MNMSHTCQAAVVTCEDFRLHQRKSGRNFIGSFIESLGVDCDLITRGGCIQDLVRPKPGHDEAVLRDLTVSVELHKVGTIYLVGHEDCGAYGHFGFTDRATELAQHFADLREAQAIVNKRFPGVNVELRFGALEPGSSDAWKITELD
jgi:Putative carbonic anhydrase